MKPQRHLHADEIEFRQLPGRLAADPLAGVSVGALSIRLSRLRAGPRSPHRHPGCAEVIYVVEGTGVAWLDGETTSVGPGDVYVIPAGVPHATLPDACGEMLVYCAFATSDLASETEEIDLVIDGAATARRCE